MSSEQVTIGSVFGRDFRVIERLAAGGMGTVYVAQQISTGKRRALKVMHAQYEGDERARERFIQEARIGAGIDSDHIVEMVGAGIDDDTNTPWIAMELLVGQDLKQIAVERGALPRDEVLEICRQLCHALGEAHRRGLVHRDLKPENIFLANPRREGIQFTVKLLDFGIAKLVQEAQTQANHTQALGSPRWMAPEQAERGGRIVPATDVWALGLIVFSLLTGRCFWRTANSPNPSVMQQMCEVIVDPIDTASSRAAEYGLGAALPAGFDEWFARCVNRTVTERFPDAHEAMTALAPLLSPSSPSKSLRPPSGRPKGGFRLDEPLPSEAAFTLGATAPINSSRPPPEASHSLLPLDPSRSLTPPESSRSGPAPASPSIPPMGHSRSITPPPAPDASAPVSFGAPPESSSRSRALPIIAGASVLTLLVVAGIALSRSPAPSPQPTLAAPSPPPALVVDAGAEMVIAAAETDVPGVAQQDVPETAEPPPSTAAPATAAPATAAPATAAPARAPTTASNSQRLPPHSAPTSAAEPQSDPSLVRNDIVYQETIRDAMRSHHVEFVACYERGTEGNLSVSGTLDILFQIGTDGRPLGISTRGLAAAPEVGRCVADVVRSQRFAPPPSGTSAILHSVRFSRNYAPPANPAPATPPPPANPPPPAPAPATEAPSGG